MEGGFEGGPVKFGRGVLDEFQAAWTMHGPWAGYGGGSGGGSRGKNTEISALEGGPDPPGPPIVGNPVGWSHVDKRGFKKRSYIDT